MRLRSRAGSSSGTPRSWLTWISSTPGCNGRRSRVTAPVNGAAGQAAGPMQRMSQKPFSRSMEAAIPPSSGGDGVQPDVDEQSIPTHGGQMSLLPPRSGGRPEASRGDDLLPHDSVYAPKKEILPATVRQAHRRRHRLRVRRLGDHASTLHEADHPLDMPDHHPHLRAARTARRSWTSWRTRPSTSSKR